MAAPRYENPAEGQTQWEAPEGSTVCEYEMPAAAEPPAMYLLATDGFGSLLDEDAGSGSL